jgi:phosphate transport system permease protein
MSGGLTETVREGVTGRLRALVAFFVALPGRVASFLLALPGRVVSFVVNIPSRVRNGFVAAKRAFFGQDPEPGELVVGSVSLLSITGVIVTFLGPNELVVYPLTVFVLTTAIGWVSYQERVARILTLVATIATVLTVGFITYFLFESAWPAIQEHGWGLFAVPLDANGNPRWFFWLESLLPEAVSTTGWNPAGGAFSLVAATWSTIVVTIIAGLIAGPLGILGALFIAEVASDTLREFIKPAVEILAGIPSIVYGFIGFAVLNNFMREAFLANGPTFLIAGIVVGVMALPTVVSVAEDALSSVPSAMNDGAIAMGATEWQTMKSISIPAAFSGISAAIILGLGRAIGETMAVAAIMAAGTSFALPLYDVFDSSVTLTSRIATSYGDASDATLEVLFVAGVMLFLIVATLSVTAQYIERRMKRELQGQE